MNAHPKHPLLPLVALALVVSAGCRPPDAGRGDLAARAFLRIVAAEDERPAGGPDLQALVDATRASVPAIRGAAVRALGRLERPAVAHQIVASLDDPDPSVRAEAANALAQAHHGGPGGGALFPLLRRVKVEPDPWVRGVLARSLGRLRLEGPGETQRERALLALTRAPDGSWAPQEQLTGAALGLESYVRGRREAVGAAVLARLRAIARYVPPRGQLDGADGRVREVAIMALSTASALSPADVSEALDDADGRVRRVGAAWLVRSGRPRPDLVDRALQDPLAEVRVEGVRALSAAVRTDRACARLEASAIGDGSVTVQLVALDALAEPCPDRAGQVRRLEAVATALPPERDGPWHPAAHAVAALAALDPGRAAALLPRFAGHPNPFVRTWAARAATRTGTAAVLRTLAGDPDANTRAEALDGLARVAGPAARPQLVAALASDDAPQVILAVAARLAMEPDSTGPAVDAAVTTLERMGRTGAETSRDPRLALVDLIGALGDSTSTRALEPFLRDFDVAVASRAAEVLTSWTGRPWLAAPRRPSRLPLPTAAELREMERSEVVLYMEDGGEVRIRLLPFNAPTNGFRLFEMARGTALDGLTFHRVVPNFVIQGGSPLANEYTGHGAYTRDEVGLTVQWRGTVGVSTRGRDTGDGQIYVNLVDNVRLDHDYTILGVVTSGMDVVDRVLEGSVIRRAVVEPAR